MSKINKAVIPVAGLGTRMLPATKAIPKELLPIVDRPIIEHVVNEAVSAGIKEIILVTRSGKEAIENHFDVNYELEHRLEGKGDNTILGHVKNIIPKDVNITSVRQPNALGLGHAVLCAKHLINREPFAVLLPDVLLLDQISRGTNFSFCKLISAWNETSIGQVMVERVDLNMIEKYGVVDLIDDNSSPFESKKLKGLLEKPSQEQAPSNLAILGRYVLPFSILNFLENITEGVNGEIQLTDALVELQKSEGINSLETDAEVYDCGSIEGFLMANVALGLRMPHTKIKLIEMLNLLNKAR